MCSKEFAAKNKLLRFDEKWVMAEVYGGEFALWLDLHDQYVSYGCLNDNYEPIETTFIIANAPTGGIALDIGANIGWHTLGLARAVGPQGKVIAFEPRQPTYNYLEKTIAQNALDEHVTLHAFGLWHENASLKLGWPRNTENPGHSFIAGEKPDLVTQDIELRPLDEVVSGLVDFIKIDVEGAEPKVIEGGERLIGENKPVILAEIYPEQLLSVSNTSARDFIKQMSRLGYRCQMLEKGYEGREIVDFPSDYGRELTNVVFSPKDRELNW